MANKDLGKAITERYHELKRQYGAPNLSLHEKNAIYKEAERDVRRNQNK